MRTPIGTGSRRGLLGLLVLSTALLVTAACTPAPARVQQQEEPRPALRVEEAERVIGHAGSVVRKADRTLRTSSLGTVLTGQALEIERTSYALDRSIGRRRSRSTRVTFTAVQVWSTSAASFPQSALVESRVVDRKHARYRALHHLVRTAADSPWLVAMAVYPKAAVVVRPEQTPTGVAVAAAPGDTFHGLRISRLSDALAAGLNDPSSPQAALFTGRTRRDHFSDQAKSPASGVRRSLDFFSRREVTAVLDGRGGAVAVVALSHLRTDRADEDHYLTLLPPFDRAYPGHYTELSQGVLDTCLVHLHAAERARVLFCDSSDGVVSVG